MHSPGLGSNPSGCAARSFAIISIPSGQMYVPPPRGLISEEMGITRSPCSGESRKWTWGPASCQSTYAKMLLAKETHEEVTIFVIKRFLLLILSGTSNTCLLASSMGIFRAFQATWRHAVIYLHEDMVKWCIRRPIYIYIYIVNLLLGRVLLDFFFSWLGFSNDCRFSNFILDHRLTLPLPLLTPNTTGFPHIYTSEPSRTHYLYHAKGTASN